uniref:CASP-like protein n=1 Tax=Aegilops tauschii subsp. strangulata TaxID=200361 RepID=A0A453F3T7_AEGTS
MRLATAVLSLASFAVMASARTSGWDGDHFDRYDQYRSVITCLQYMILSPLHLVRICPAGF